MRKCWKLLPVTFFLVTGIFFAGAQKTPQKNWNSARILHELEKMRHVGRVLYIAAHPDDENVELISYLVNVKGFETAYMSLTRGDGGQDLLGPEVREELGLIRTQELLMARSVDGGEQFFSRANDFGFSKTAAETFNIWNRDAVLSDIVWTIRKFKPDIIITRFSPTYTKTHGHHQASAILAQEAFTAAADSSRYPDQLKYVAPWQAQAIFWNTSYWFFRDKTFDTAGLYHNDVGLYIPLLGKSVNELAAESESMHKSQGNGSSPDRVDRTEYFTYLQGRKPESRDIFTDVYDRWIRIKGCEDVPEMLEDIVNKFDPERPAASIPALEKLYYKLLQFRGNYLVDAKIKDLQEIILQCAGVYTEAISTKEFIAVGDSLNLSLNVATQNDDANVYLSTAYLMVNGQKLCTLKKYLPPPPKSQAQKTKTAEEPALHKYETIKSTCLIPDSTSISGPYWLEKEPEVGMYRVDDQLLRGLPQNPTQIVVHVRYTDGIEMDIPVFFKNVDPVKGEQYSLARIVPPAVANPAEKLLVFNNSEAKDLSIKVKSFTKGKAKAKLNIPTGWTITPAFADIEMLGDGSEQILKFSVTPPAKPSSDEITIEIEAGNHAYDRSSEVIPYDHIPEQLLLPRSIVKVERMNLVTSNKTIGYIVGAGDDIPTILKQLGYKVEIIPAAQLATIDLKRFDVIIAGIRAYNTVNELKYSNDRLFDYVKNGGNYVVQYNKNFDLVTDKIGPYMLHPANIRTTEEDSKVTFLAKDNPILNTPNKITASDFDGWVQERGLYYPDKWDTVNYVPILEMNDSGEKPLDGSLLTATYGKGHFTYTGLSFFRELPAGVPGAFRLFINIIELGPIGK
jgi:LmbE family N-acetylglucosaminyl deacetylase